MSNSTANFRFPLLAAGLFGLTGVAFGAMGAHALKATLIERGMVQAWDSAARYHLFHAVALLAVAAWIRAGDPADESRLFVWVTRCWCAGIVLFSGSLYWLVLGGPRWLGPVTPLGGIALMAGWLLVAIAAFSKRG
ncbi:MAG: DUF423 domain-containing protein [Opitutus sp.]|nr:DUF423 domain-containing protein [Opitutus sp.]